MSFDRGARARTAIAEARAVHGDDWEAHCPWRLLRTYALPDGAAAESTDTVCVYVVNRGTGSGSPLYTDSVRVNYLLRELPTASYPEGRIHDHSGYSERPDDIFSPQLGVPATLLVSNRQTSRYLLFDTGGGLVGWMNVGSGEVRSPFAELKRRPQENAPFDYKGFVASRGLAMHAFDGVHLISPEIFGLMAQWPERFSIIDFYLSVCDTHKIAAYMQPGLQMVDVGKPDSLHEAESRFFPCL